MPVLAFIAGSILIFGQDHPCGSWENRSLLPNLENNHYVTGDNSKEETRNEAGNGLGNVCVNPKVDTAVKGSPTLVTYFRILASPLTWLPPLAYMTTFGLELAIDGNLANVLFSLFNKKRPGFGQAQAGYYTAIL